MNDTSKPTTQFNDTAAIRRVIKLTASEVRSLREQRKGINQTITAQMSDIESKGIDPKAFKLSLQVSKLTKAEREQFFFALSVCMAAQGMTEQLDLELPAPGEEPPEPLQTEASILVPPDLLTDVVASDAVEEALVESIVEADAQAFEEEQEHEEREDDEDDPLDNVGNVEEPVTTAQAEEWPTEEEANSERVAMEKAEAATVARTDSELMRRAGVRSVSR